MPSQLKVFATIKNRHDVEFIIGYACENKSQLSEELKLSKKATRNWCVTKEPKICKMAMANPHKQVGSLFANDNRKLNYIVLDQYDET